MARQRYYRPSARCCRALRVSADRTARPGPDTRGKPRLLDLERRIPARDRFARDSPLEEAGFEPSVPRKDDPIFKLPHQGFPFSGHETDLPFGAPNADER
jgi:hypothetical protein